MQYEFQVENLKCAGCANTIKRTLLNTAGVTEVAVAVDDSRVTVSAESDIRERIAAALASIGYPEQGSNTFKAKATSYVSCAVGRMSD